MHQAEDVVVRKLGAAFEEVELDGNGEAGDFAAQLLDELHSGLHRAAGGEEVVDDDDALAAFYGIGVNFQRVRAVFEVVLNFGRGGGELLRLAHGDEAGVQAVSQRRAEDEAAGLDAENEIDVFADVVLGEGVDELREAVLVLEQRGDVVEQDAGFGEVRDGADELFEGLAVDGVNVCGLQGVFSVPSECVCIHYSVLTTDSATRRLLSGRARASRLRPDPV